MHPEEVQGVSHANRTGSDDALRPRSTQRESNAMQWREHGAGGSFADFEAAYEELLASEEQLRATNEELSVANRQLRLQADEMDRMRRDAEAALAEFTRVTDVLDQVVWQRDASLERLLFVSRRVEDMFGISTV